ncbi:MAG: hypothetical protein JRF63_13230 [Deltaproteobacteria bacterium]|nr:hypothetical protein [Deltaproteobacteria bacterium]
MGRDQEDRRERDWREIDRRKDQSKHRQADRPRVPEHQQARAESASKVYKSKLDAFFDGSGKAPAHIKDKLQALDDTSPEGKQRITALKKIKDAGTSLAVEKAVGVYLKSWALPPDHDVLAQVLTCSDEEYVGQALEIIDELLSKNRPPRRKTILEQRLRRVISLSDDPDLADKAQAIIKQLRLFS